MDINTSIVLPIYKIFSNFPITLKGAFVKIFGNAIGAKDVSLSTKREFLYPV
jgi:hypothetical protein